eukprot:g40079.t1
MVIGHRAVGSQAEYEVLLLQFVGGVIVLEEAQNGHVSQGVGGGVKMVRDRKVLIIVHRAQIFRELVTESAHVTGDGDGEAHEVKRGIGDGPGEFEVGVKGAGRVDELFEHLMGAQGSTNIAINIAEEE